MSSILIKESSSLLSSKLLNEASYDWLDEELKTFQSEMITFVIPIDKAEHGRDKAENENLINLHCENKYRYDEKEGNSISSDDSDGNTVCDEKEVTESCDSIEEAKSPPSSDCSLFSDIMNTLNRKFEENVKSDESAKNEYQNGGNVRASLQLDLQPLLDECEEGTESLDNFPTDTPASAATLSVSTDDKKSGKLKRVSFGSSKGSMVETLFYDAFSDDEKPLLSVNRNRPYIRYPVSRHATSTPKAGISSREDDFLKVRADSGVILRPASRVRVTFYESERPLTVSSPEPSEGTEPPDLDSVGRSPSPHLLKTAMGTMLTPEHGSVAYDRQISSEGPDNPFRPDGDLSREADELVELIKEGRPIAEAVKIRSASQADSQPEEVDSLITPEKDATLLATPPASPVKNGSTTQAAPSPPQSPKPVPVEVQHGVVVPPSGEGQVERVVIKKKNKKCCVVM